MTRKELIEDKRNVTGKISDTCRYIAFGLLIVYYTIMSGTEGFPTQLRAGRGVWVVHAIGIIGATAVLLDYLHYLCGAKTVQESLDDKGATDYDKSSRWYKGRALFYSLKQWAVGIGSALLVALVIYAVWTPPSSTKPDQKQASDKGGTLLNGIK